MPLVAASGDSLAQASLARYFQAKRRKATLGYGGLGVMAIGSVFQLAGMTNALASHLPKKGHLRETADRQVTIGTVLVGLGGVSGLGYLLTANRPRQLLHQTIEAYHQSLARRISWHVAPTGTGLVLVGRF